MKEFKRGLAFLLAVVLVMSSMSVGVQAATTKAKKATVKSVAITKPDTKTLVMKKGASFQLKTKVTTTGKNVSKAVTYTSSKKSVATVSAKGKIKALKNGNATITVKSKANKKKKATLKVVVKAPVTKVTLNKKEVTLTEGESFTVKATVSPKTATVKKVAYTTSNKKVATVSSKGVIKAVKEGKATITVTSTDGNAKKATCKVTVKKAAPQETAAPTPTPTAKPTPTEEPNTGWGEKGEEAHVAPALGDELSYDGFTELWRDDFEGTELNLDDWNIEEHPANWVNKEWQQYVNSEDNIFVEDGKLHLRAIKNADGTYTSGRVNTQKKQSVTYGMMEAVAKVPAGKGFLPAFWMMPDDEQLYGQWPVCGEIDCMEVMGHETDKVYGTIHYGAPHEEKQGTYTVSENDFAESFHKFTCVWDPGRITWYVDGVKYHEATNWFSAIEGAESNQYPAPFDQPFHIILNLAVGGSWVGYPDADASYFPSDYEIDSVRILQRDKYDTNVKAPEASAADMRQPDATGNFVHNGDFAIKESLTDDDDWKFMTALDGEANATISNNSILIETTNEGTKDYSVQLVQAGIPLEQGATYEVTFDAKAGANRTFNSSVKAPDHGWATYGGKDFAVTTEMKPYTYSFRNTSATDANARLEFNMGHWGSTDDIVITNVTLKKTKDAEPIVVVKDVRSDGNFVYNGKFQEGEGYTGYWDLTNKCKATAKVTDLADGRRLEVSVPAGVTDLNKLVLSQGELQFNKVDATTYDVSFDVESDAAKKISVTVAGVTKEVTLKAGKQNVKFSVTSKAGLSESDAAFSMALGTPGKLYIDNIMVQENPGTNLIRNGLFNSGRAYYTVYENAQGKTSADFSNGVCKLTLAETTSNPNLYDIQLKQGGVTLEKDAYYKLSFDANSSILRKIQVNLQRNGEADKDWRTYLQVDKKLKEGDNHFDIIFQMTDETDEDTVFNFGLGGRNIKTEHTMIFDNIVLEKTDERPAEPEEEITVSGNKIKNGTFSQGSANWLNTMYNGGNADFDYDEGKADIIVFNLGTEEGSVGLKQSGITLVKDCTYTVTATITSDVDRDMKFASMDNGNKNWYVDGGNTASLKAGEPQTVEFKVKNTAVDVDRNAYISFNFGNVGENCPAKAEITVDDVVMLLTDGEEVIPEEPEKPTVSGNTVLFEGTYVCANYVDGLALSELDGTTIKAGDKLVVTATVDSSAEYANFKLVNASAEPWTDITSSAIEWDKAAGGTQMREIVFDAALVEKTASDIVILGNGFTVTKVELVSAE